MQDEATSWVDAQDFKTYAGSLWAWLCVGLAVHGLQCVQSNFCCAGHNPEHTKAGFKLRCSLQGARLQLHWSTKDTGTIYGTVAKVHPNGTVDLEYDKERATDEIVDSDHFVDMFDLSKKYKSAFGRTHRIKQWSLVY